MFIKKKVHTQGLPSLPFPFILILCKFYHFTFLPDIYPVSKRGKRTYFTNTCSTVLKCRLRADNSLKIKNHKRITKSNIKMPHIKRQVHKMFILICLIQLYMYFFLSVIPFKFETVYYDKDMTISKVTIVSLNL